MNSKNTKSLSFFEKKDTLTIILIFFSIVVIYHPSILYDFLYTDDYLYFFPKITDIGYSDFLTSNLSSIWDYSMAVGRPFLYYFILAGNSLISTPADATIFRIIALICLMIFSIMAYLWLRMNSRSCLSSFIIIVLIVSSPSMVLSISWVTVHLAIYSMLLALITIFIIERGLKNNTWQYYFFAFFIMLISLNGYSPFSMIYWCFVLVKLTDIRSLDLYEYKSKLIPFFIVGLSSMIGYFIIGKIFFEFGGGLEGHPVKKIFWLITEPFPYSLSFNTLFPNIFLVVCSFFVIFYGVIYGYIETLRENRTLTFNKLLIKIELLKTSLILGLLFLSFSPIILSSYSVNSHRILLVLKFSLIIMFIHGLDKIKLNSKLRSNVISLILIITTPIVVYYGYYINKNFLASPQQEEYLYLKNELDANLTEETEFIHLYRPPWWTGNVPYDMPEGFDFGVFSSSVSSNAKNMVLAALNDLNLGEKDIKKDSLFIKKYKISSSVRSSQVRSYRDGIGERIPTHNVLVIDMNNHLKKIETNLEN